MKNENAMNVMKNFNIKEPDSLSKTAETNLQ